MRQGQPSASGDVDAPMSLKKREEKHGVIEPFLTWAKARVAAKRSMWFRGWTTDAQRSSLPTEIDGGGIAETFGREGSHGMFRPLIFHPMCCPLFSRKCHTCDCHSCPNQYQKLLPDFGHRSNPENIQSMKYISKIL